MFSWNIFWLVIFSNYKYFLMAPLVLWVTGIARQCGVSHARGSQSREREEGRVNHHQFTTNTACYNNHINITNIMNVILLIITFGFFIILHINNNINIKGRVNHLQFTTNTACQSALTKHLRFVSKICGFQHFYSSWGSKVICRPR